MEEYIDPELTITVKVKDLQEMVQKKAEELVEKQKTEIDRILLNNKIRNRHSNIYTIVEKNEDDTITEKTFNDVKLATKYVENKYKRPITHSMFLSLINRLKKEPKRWTVIDKTYRNKILEIISKKYS